VANITYVRADYAVPEHAEAIAVLMAGYSGDVMGGGVALPAAHCKRIASELSGFGHAYTLLAFADNTEPVGLATSIKSFSTFVLKPLLNLHDFFVAPSFRGRGVGSGLLEATEALARELGCCKLTLEVLSNNTNAKRLYTRAGFAPYQLTEETGIAEFWQKLCS